MTHVGDYIPQKIGRAKELLGSDVNLIHRLLKNKVAETTGWRAYLLFTKQALENAAMSSDGLLPLQESYEHLGNVETFTADLRRRYEELTAEHRVFLTPDDAHVTVPIELEAPPAVVWDWLNDPQKRLLWSGTEVRPLLRPGGRISAGAQNHCVHGKTVSIETILDWRPFTYCTVETKIPFGTIRTTFVLEETERGTRLEDRTSFKPRLSILAPLGKPFLKLLYKMINADEQYRKLARGVQRQLDQERVVEEAVGTQEA